jgi:hypothetical protein
MRFIILACLCSAAALTGAAFSEPAPALATHEVKVWGTIHALESDTVWIRTPRQVVAVAVGNDTRVRLGNQESRLAHLRAGQTVRSLNEWRDGVLRCQEMVVVQE